jgi:beta-1,4-mannosyl-glycoprotein beta-1,4-N-acetylglucosaminyltransferase
MVWFICALSTYINADIYDCFCFFNEFDLLDIRLNELDSIVDKFVLVESCETQTGIEKPLFFFENKERYSKFLHKIIHIKLTNPNPLLKQIARENWQRNQILRGLTHCKNKDIIMISDLDEIPNTSILKTQLKKRYKRNLVLRNDMFFFQLNRQRNNARDWENKVWLGTAIVPFSYLKEKTPQEIRNERSSYFNVPDGGWHFSWMGGVDQMRLKAKSVYEGAGYNFESKTDEEILEWMYLACPKIVTINQESNFPNYLKNKYQYFFEKGYIAE